MSTRRQREVADSVVVVTGASSGLGLTVAKAFAAEGAHLVLAARTGAALERVSGECRALGATATPVVTDVGNADAVQALANRAVEVHGRIDTWVNAAGVLLAGPLGSESTAELERIVRTNIEGPLFGARAALAQFQRQGEGVLIDVSSLLGLLPNPLVPSYVMSKFAVRGLSMSLQHWARAWPGIHVCLVLPGPIDTPLFQRGANHTESQLRAIPPAISPERVAAKIVSCARRPRRQVTIGALGHCALVAHRLVPRATEWVVATASAALLVRPRGAAHTSGALFAPAAGGDATGGWRLGRWRRKIGDSLGRAQARRAVKPNLRSAARSLRA